MSIFFGLTVLFNGTSLLAIMSFVCMPRTGSFSDHSAFINGTTLYRYVVIYCCKTIPISRTKYALAGTWTRVVRCQSESFVQWSEFPERTTYLCTQNIFKIANIPASFQFV